MSTFIRSLRGQMSTPLYELGGKCPHLQFLGRGQMSEGANVRLPVQMHIKSEVNSFEVRVYQGFTRFNVLFRPYGFYCRGV